MLNKYKEEVELPEISDKLRALNDFKNSVLRKKPTQDEIMEHSRRVDSIIKRKRDESTAKRMELMRSHSQTHAHLKSTSTQSRIKMQDEIAKIIRQENEEIKVRILQRRKEFGKSVSKNYVPKISEKKQEEMRRIIETHNASAREKVSRIRYDRSPDSILNRSKHLFKLNEYATQQTSINGGSSRGHTPHNVNASRTLAFGKEISDMEYSPVRAYIAAGELEPVKENWRTKHKRKKHDRSKSSMDGKYSKPSGRQYAPIYSSQNNSSKEFEPPVDWLQKRRDKRAENGRNVLYKESIPKVLTGDKVSSFRDIRYKTSEVERMADRLEKEALDMYSSTNLVRDNNKVGAMYVDAIKAKAALLEQL